MKKKELILGAFSLIELMVTISIIIVLSGTVIAGYFRFSQRQEAMNDARSLMSQMKKIQSLAQNLVYPDGCGGLQNYKLSPVCTGVDCRSVRVVATCVSGGDANGEIVITESEEVLGKAYFTDQTGTYTFSAGTGVISPVGSLEISYLNSPYQFGVEIYENGNIAVVEK